MKLLRNLLTLALVIGAAAIGVLFALQNETPVALDVLVYTFAPKSLALWLLSAFAIGGLVGMLLSSFLLVRQRASLGSANRKLTRARAEVDKLRTAGLKDSE